MTRFLKRNLGGLAFAAAILVSAAGPARAQIRDGTGGLEINAFYGLLNGLGDTEYENDVVPWRLDNDPYFGGRLGYVLDFGLGVEGFFGYVDSKVVGSQYEGAGATVLNYGGDLTYNFNLARSIQLSVLGGAGLQSFDLDVDGLDSESALTWNYGAALKIFPTRWLGFRFDWRNYVSPDGLQDAREFINPGAAPKETLLSTEWTAGLSFFLWGPKDSDGDGVEDNDDLCPDTPKGVKVDSTGCPLDADMDGVGDYMDQCPNTPRGAVVDETGCPLDSDADGVFDGLDQCPATPKGAEVDAKGCPSDRDGDGVFFGIDLCPNTPAGVVVNATGCPVDSDGDGVFDGPDACPNTPAGARVDARGCLVQLELRNVEFEFNSFELTRSARSYLSDLAGQIVQQADPEGTGRLELRGFTDSVGAEAYNQRLSESRAEAVRDFLLSTSMEMEKFIDRLDAVGYGEADPVATNDTEEGRARNRRVELHIIQPGN
ncbi:MAG: OmpA family protein [Candidatus Palauibacterales bacterium]|nr:OmpA family protein [Candidatus Palauibacterales bacterium]MDP2482695.1 OmpA family protein [Candidatus Palauibacterales bacterium]